MTEKSIRINIYGIELRFVKRAIDMSEESCGLNKLESIRNSHKKRGC